MPLLDKLRDLYAQPADGDLLEFFGINPGDPLKITGDGITVGNEFVPLNEARRAMAGPPILQPPGRGRDIVIGDL